MIHKSWRLALMLASALIAADVRAGKSGHPPSFKADMVGLAASRPSLLLSGVLLAATMAVLLGPTSYANASLEAGRMGPRSSATHDSHDLLQTEDKVVGPQAYFLDSGVIVKLDK